MGFVSVLGFAQQLIKQCVQAGDAVIDATLGTGVDTAFLAQTVRESGHVFGFDIQTEAMERTRSRLVDLGLNGDHIRLFHASHDQMADRIAKPFHGKIRAVMFNLGYLPGGDPSVITTPKTTIDALQCSLDLLSTDGVITVVLYPGHPGGDTEAAQVEQWLHALPANNAQVLIYRMVNASPKAPYLIAVKKR